MEPTENFEKFRDDVFLSQNMLNDKTAMEYFYGSQFFDTNSINQKRRRGVQVSENIEGIEYRLVYCNSVAHGCKATNTSYRSTMSPWDMANQLGVFVIQKYSRDSKGTESPLDCYYVLGGTIYRAPSFGALIRQRTLKTVQHLNDLIDSILSMTSWSLIEGHCWGRAEKDTTTTINTTTSANESTDQQNCFDQDYTMQDMSQELEMHQRNQIKTKSCVLENLYTKRSCADAGRVIEDCFSSFANASLKFNSYVDKTRQNWQTRDDVWRDASFKSLEHS